MRSRRRYLAVTWDCRDRVDFADVVDFVEQALKENANTGQKPIFLHGGHHQQFLIVRVPHTVVPGMRLLLGTDARIRGCQTRLRILLVSGTLKSLRRKLRNLEERG